MGIVRRIENKLSYSPDDPPDDGLTSWLSLWKNEQEKSYVNRWRDKTRG